MFGNGTWKVVSIKNGEVKEDLGNEGLGRHIHGYGLLEVVTAKRPAEGVAWNWVVSRDAVPTH